jgi:DNA-binding SARP family transcriptional activator
MATSAIAQHPFTMGARPLKSPDPKLKLIGGFELYLGEEAVTVSESSQRLLVYLALGGPRGRRVIASYLWPDKAEERAGANLRSALWRLPTQDAAGRCVELVREDHCRLELADCVEVDARSIEQVGWSIIHGGETDSRSFGNFLIMGDLLPGWYDDWVLLERERLGQLRLHFLETMAYRFLRKGAITEALDAALRLVAFDPLREGSQRVLLTLYCSEGSLGQAQRQLDAYRALLHETFGCEPKLSIGRILHEMETGVSSPTPETRGSLESYGVD